MAIFKKKTNEYDNAANKMNSTSKSSERIIFEQLSDNSEQVASLVDQLKLGKPLMLDFSRLNVTEGNKMLAFLAGACYASDARQVLVKEKVYLFARNIDFLDGSLQEFIANL
ncbi:MAG: cell division protein SepF [bacterium]